MNCRQPDRLPPSDTLNHQLRDAIQSLCFCPNPFHRLDLSLTHFQYVLNIQDGTQQSLCAANPTPSTKIFKGFNHEQDAAVIASGLGDLCAGNQIFTGLGSASSR